MAGKETTHIFRKGALRVASKNDLFVVRPWGRRAGAWEWTRGLGVDPIEPHLDIALLLDPDPPDFFLEYEWEEDWVYAASPRLRRAILDSIPPAVIEVVAKVEPLHQWPLLQLLNRCGEPALQLARSSLALALLVSRERDDHGQRKLAAAKRSTIARHFGYDAEGATAALGKLTASGLHERGLELLKRAQRQPAVWKLCLHLPRLTGDVLELLSNGGLLQRVRYSFLVDLASCEQRVDAVERLDELTRLDRHIGRHRPRFRSIAELDHAHDQHVERLRLCYETGSYDDVTFPSAPIPGNESIQYIATGWELMREGNDLRHCIGSYLRSALAGEVACYRVLAPERATLSLRWRDGGWMLDELRRFANAPVAPETASAVRDWFEAGYGRSSARQQLLLALWQRRDGDLLEPPDLDGFQWPGTGVRELRGSGQVFELDAIGLREVIGTITVGEMKRLLARDDGCAGVYGVRLGPGRRPAIIEIFRSSNGFWDYRRLGGAWNAHLDSTVRRWIMRAYLHDESVPAIDFYEVA